MMLPSAGHEFKFQGDHFTVGFISKQTVRYTCVAGGRMLRTPLETFLTMMASPDFEHINKDWTDPSSHYDKKHLEIRNDLFSLIRFVESKTESRRSQNVVSNLLDEYAKAKNKEVISASNFAKKYKKYVESGYNIDSLIPRHHDKGNRNKVFSDEQELKVIETLQNCYLTNTSQPLTISHRDLRLELMETEDFKASPLNYQRMSYSTFRRRSKDLDIADRLISKDGKRLASKRLRAAGKKLETGFPLQFVEADGYVVDCHVVDESTGELMGRPYLTVFIDRATRSILSYTMSLKAFSVETLLSAFKGALRQDNGLPGGRISHVIVDNGKDYDSHSFRNAIFTVGADLKPCRINDPNSKPFIESVFRTFNLRCFHTLNGTTFSNPQQRGDYDSEENAIYTIEELDEIFRLAIDDYHQTIHSQLNNAPILVWQDWLKAKSGLIEEVSLNEINIFLNTVKLITINNGTVRFDGLTYKSHDLSAIEQEMKLLGCKPKVHVYIDHDDLSHVYVENVLNPKQPLIKAFSTDPDRTNGLMLSELREQKKDISLQRKIQQSRLIEMGAEEKIIANNARRKTIKENALLRKQRHIESKKQQRKKPKHVLEIAPKGSQTTLETTLNMAISHDEFGDMNWSDENE